MKREFNMNKKSRFFWIISFVMANAILLAGCGSTTGRTTDTGSDELDIAIREASNYLNDNIPAQSIIIILNVQSESTALSNYIIDELIANAVNDRNFIVVDRQQLESIRAEQNFQLSGEVDDKLALEIGRFFGAQTIVSGTISSLGNRYRMTVRALEVQTARVQGQFNKNLTAWETIVALISGGTTATANSGRSTNGTTQPSVQSAESNIIDGVVINAEQAFLGVRRYFRYPETNSWNDGVSRLDHIAFQFHQERFNLSKLSTYIDYWENLPRDGTFYSVLELYRDDQNINENISFQLQLRYDRDENRFLQLMIIYPINGKRASYELRYVAPEKVLEIVQAMVDLTK